MAKLVGSARIIRILIVMFAGCLSFKLSEPPSGTETQGAPGRVEGPEDASGAEGDGLGGLGKNLNFLLVKVAQLEALAEMQQAEIATHRLKIASLEKERHSGSDGILLETQSEEEAKTRLEETTAVLKNVWRKHEHQRRTGHFKGSGPMRSGPEALRERGLKNETAGLAAESEENAIIPFVPGGRRRVVSAPSWASDPVGTLEDGFAAASSTVDKVNYAKDQLATHAFDTVEKATTLLENVLGLPGFSDFWVKLHRPEAPSFDLSGKLKLGKIKIEINLISANKHWELDLGTIDLPGSLKAVVSTSLSTVQGAMSLGGELLSCSNWHLPGEAVKCIGNKIVDLFAQLKKVASTALATVEGAMSLGQELQSCSNWHLPGEAVKCFAGKTIEKVEELNFPGDSAVQQVQKMITVGRDLNCANWHVNGGLVTCLGTKIIDKVPPLKATVNVGHELSACSQQTGDALMQCLGTIIIENTPPFSFLSHLGDLLSEFLEGFAKMAGSVAKQVLKGSSSLIQEAALSKFPAIGAPAAVHHSAQSLVITKHTQKKQGKLSTLQMKGDPPKDGISFTLHDEGSNYQSKLITQFHGYERDTSSCLAFAPKSRQQAGQVSESDWQVSDPNDFVQLEPWAVPCGTDWMKEHESKWQGYSFYTGELNIEQCVTVSYGVNVQPVFALVAGVQIEVMPKPLVSVESTVCWPKQRPDGQDLSMLRLKISTTGVLLFSKTLRLAKRYRDPTDFVDHHGHLQRTMANWEQETNPRVAISRTKLMQMEAHQSHNQSHQAGKDEGEQGVFEWMEDEDTYLASANYSPELGVNLTSELHGVEAQKRLSLAATKSEGVFELFNFQHDGNVNFDFKALMDGKFLEMRMQMGFGPFQSEPKTVKLVDITHQFEVVLYALPFISMASRGRAIDALNTFTHDMPPPIVLEPGTTVALWNVFFQRYLVAASTGAVGSGPTHNFDLGLPNHWHLERWTVVDAGEGKIALHHPRYNGFMSLAASGLSLKHGALTDFHPAGGWEAETFVVVSRGGGTDLFGLQNPATKRFVSCGAHHDTYVSPPSDVLHAGWTHQQFRVEVLKPRLKVGSTVGLWSPLRKHWLRLNGADLDKGGNVMMPDQQPNLGYQTDWEKFLVVDADNGDLALWNPFWRAFVKIENGDARASGPIYPQQLPSIWPSCKFQVVPTHDATISLHFQEGFLAMGAEPGAAGVFHTGWTIQSLPDAATWERFVVYEVNSGGPAEVPPPVGWNFQITR